MPTERISETTTRLAELMLDLTRKELAAPVGRARLVAALRTTLAMVEGVGAAPRCDGCVMARPGARRAVAQLAELMTDAQEHVEFLAELTAPQPRAAESLAAEPLIGRPLGRA